MSVSYHEVEQPEQVSEREREDAMGAYLMMFASLAAGLPLPIINLIAAIIYYYVNRSKSRFVHFHALQSLLSQFPTSVLNAVAVFWAVRIFWFGWDNWEPFKGYLIMVAAANLLYVIFSLVAAFRARKGRFYYFLFFGKWAYHQVYRVREETGEVIRNTPPV